MIVSGGDLFHIFEAAMDIIKQARRLFSEPFNFKSIRNLLVERLERLVPENGHKLCSSRFGLTLTNIWTLDCPFVSEFESRQDLIDALVACCFIPVWSGSFSCPKYKNKPYCDGGFINNRPTFEMRPEEIESGRRTICMCPFPTEEIEIAPKVDDYLFSLSTVGLKYKVDKTALPMGVRALIPCKISDYKPFFEGGFNQMKQFILKNDMIKCKSCFAKHDINRATITKRYELPKLNHNCLKTENTKSCLSCLKLKEKVDSLRPPPEFLRLMED